jgi:aryl-alcohol dehydrogenase-like predicted oxidoreductase
MAAWQLTKALWQSDVDGLERFEVTQPRFNAAYRREDDMEAGGITVENFLEVCADQDLAVCPYSPLEGGFLTGKYDREGVPEGSRGDLNDWSSDQWSERQWRVLEAVEDVAEAVDATPAQVALRWLMDRERFTVIPIVGARTPQQLRENAGAVDLSLSADQRGRIDEAYGDA